MNPEHVSRDRGPDSTRSRTDPHDITGSANERSPEHHDFEQDTELITPADVDRDRADDDAPIVTTPPS